MQRFVVFSNHGLKNVMKYSNTLIKNCLFLTVCCLLVQTGFAQSTELKVNAYSGLFFFKGDGSSSSNVIVHNPQLVPNYSLNAYGRRPGFSYSVELQTQKVTKNKDVFGVSISYEKLTSNLKTKILEESGTSNSIPKLTDGGKITLTNSFATISPFVGHRIATRKSTTDLSAGFDLALCLKSHEVGKVSSNNEIYTDFVDNIAKPAIDIRPRLQINTCYNRLGYSLGYSLGLTNYQTQQTNKAFTNYLRFGISYKLK